MTGFSIQHLLSIDHIFHPNLERIQRRSIHSIAIDSRIVKQNELFVALRGENHDGHSYIEDVLLKKPVVCVVDEKWYAKNKKKYPSAPLFVVENTLKTLGDIARVYRKQFDIPIIGITGSNGKTTTKEMIAAILKTKYNVLYTQGNYNNHIGLPLTLFRLNENHSVVVLEMGTNQPGDIEYLCSIAQQTHALITNIGCAHIELLTNRKSIAKEKTTIFGTLPKYGIAFINADEPLLQNAAMKMTKKITFGSTNECDVTLSSVKMDGEGKPTFTVRAPSFSKQRIECSLRMHGMHSTYNALAAMTVGFVFQCAASKMIEALEITPASDNRFHVFQQNGVTIINDTYNANPDSTIAAISTLSQMSVPGKKIVIFGDMLELGVQSKKEHNRVGEFIAKQGIAVVLTYGKESKHVTEIVKRKKGLAWHYTNKKLLMNSLHQLVQKGDTVLVKGSRGMKMEEVVDELMKATKTPGGKKTK